MIERGVLIAMRDAGCSAEQIVAVVLAAIEADEHAADERREADRIRKQEKRAAERALSEMSDGQSGHEDCPSDGVEADAAKETPHTPKENYPSGINTPSTPTGSSPTPFSELRSVLDETRARAVVQHRQRLRKALTPHAAHLLAKRLSEFPDPNAAADEMIERGWQSIRPGWGSSPPRASPAAAVRKQNPALDTVDRLMEKIDAVSPSETQGNPPYPRLVAFSGSG